ncbi:MAG: FtsX-like permease family protein [Ilumatobacteraceae bacterium]
MTAVLYRAQAQIRRRWVATSLLILIIGIIAGVVFACAAGARRTMTVADRYTATAGGDFDALVTQQDGGLPRTRSVAGLAGVELAHSFTFVFGGVSRSGSDEQLDSLVFGGSAEAAGATLVEGRNPDPTEPGEFVASRSFVTSVGAGIGDEFDLITLTQEQADATGFYSESPAGPHLPALLVGIVEGAAALQDPTPTLFFSPALLGEPAIGVSQSMIAVRFRDGVDASTFQKQLDELPDSQSFGIGSGRLVGKDLRRAVDAQALGMWLLAIVAGVAAIAVLGQMLTRHVRQTAIERDQLNAIGFTDGQTRAESIVHAAVPIVAGCVLGVILAIASSGRFPTGLARRLEPNAGIEVDLAVLTGVAVVLVASLVLWTLGALVLDTRTTRGHRTSPIVDGMATRSPSATAATGLRLAFARSARERSSVRSRSIAVLSSVGLLVGATVFANSMSRLIDEPVRYGVNYDLAYGDDGADSLPDGAQELFDSDPDVISLVLYASDHARIGSTNVQLLGMQRIRGDGAPTIVEGSLPVTEDEIAFGRVTAGDVGVGVGDAVTLTGTTGSQQFRVTGIAVVPGFGANEGVGEGGLLTFEALTTLNDGASLSSLAVRFRPGATAAADRISAAIGAERGDRFRPSVIVNLERIRAIPFVLAGLLGVLALLTLVNVIVASVRTRERELAILRSLGADTSWITRAIHWQATLLTVVPVSIGAVVGVIAGQQVFAALADSIGALSDAAISVALIGVVVIGCVVLANAAAAIPARRARRAVPAATLQTE